MRGILKRRRVVVKSANHPAQMTLSAERIGEARYLVTWGQLSRSKLKLCGSYACPCDGALIWPSGWRIVDRPTPRELVFEVDEFKLVNHLDEYQGVKRFATFAHAVSDLEVARRELRIYDMHHIVDLRIVHARAVWDGSKWTDTPGPGADLTVKQTESEGTVYGRDD